MKIWAILGHFGTFFQHFFKTCIAISTFSVGFASFKNKKISPIYDKHIGVNFVKIAQKIRIWQPFEKCLIFMIFPIFSVFSAFLWKWRCQTPYFGRICKFSKQKNKPYLWRLHRRWFYQNRTKNTDLAAIWKMLDFRDFSEFWTFSAFFRKTL